MFWKVTCSRLCVSCLSYPNFVVYLNRSIPWACQLYSVQNFAKCDCILIWQHHSDPSLPQSSIPLTNPFSEVANQPFTYRPSIQWGATCNPSTQKLQLSRCSAQTATATLNFPGFLGASLSADYWWPILASRPNWGKLCQAPSFARQVPVTGDGACSTIFSHRNHQLEPLFHLRHRRAWQLVLHQTRMLKKETNQKKPFFRNISEAISWEDVNNKIVFIPDQKMSIQYNQKPHNIHLHAFISAFRLFSVAMSSRNLGPLQRQWHHLRFLHTWGSVETFVSITPSAPSSSPLRLTTYRAPK